MDAKQSSNKNTTNVVLDLTSLPLENLSERDVSRVVADLVQGDEVLHLVKELPKIPTAFYQIPSYNHQYQSYVATARRKLQAIGHWVNVPPTRQWLVEKNGDETLNTVIEKLNVEVMLQNTFTGWQRKPILMQKSSPFSRLCRKVKKLKTSFGQ